MNSLYKKSALIAIVIIIADQLLKIWVKTHMFLGESSYENWGIGFKSAQLLFTENPGMAFGWMLPGSGGKIALSIFRIICIIGMIYFINYLIKEKRPKGLIICITMIVAGAIGNMIDCMFYGKLFSATGYSSYSVAEILPESGGYAPFLQGKVVDMLYFPIINTQWPDWLPIWGGKSFVFFSPIFNIADSAVTIGVFIILIFHKKYFPNNLQSSNEEINQAN